MNKGNYTLSALWSGLLATVFLVVCAVIAYWLVRLIVPARPWVGVWLCTILWFVLSLSAYEARE